MPSPSRGTALGSRSEVTLPRRFGQRILSGSTLLDDHARPHIRVPLHGTTPSTTRGTANAPSWSTTAPQGFIMAHPPMVHPLQARSATIATRTHARMANLVYLRRTASRGELQDTVRRDGAAGAAGYGIITPAAFPADRTDHYDFQSFKGTPPSSTFDPKTWRRDPVLRRTHRHAVAVIPRTWLRNVGRRQPLLLAEAALAVAPCSPTDVSASCSCSGENAPVPQDAPARLCSDEVAARPADLRYFTHVEVCVDQILVGAISPIAPCRRAPRWRLAHEGRASRPRSGRRLHSGRAFKIQVRFRVADAPIVSPAEQLQQPFNSECSRCRPTARPRCNSPQDYAAVECGPSLDPPGGSTRQATRAQAAFRDRHDACG